jgi:hypothetical protein
MISQAIRCVGVVIRLLANDNETTTPVAIPAAITNMITI